MPESIPGENRSGVLQWVIVLGVGALVVTVVLALNLIPRLNGGQKVLNAAKPAFASQRLRADVAGINIISDNVNMANPIVTPQGGGAAEVPAVVAYVAKTHHVSPAQALAMLKQNFPHTLALLQAIPLSAVTAELPHLVAFLEQALKVSPATLGTALKTNFPALDQAITNLPAVTNGWNSIPGLDGLTRFDGSPVSTVPQLRDYFKDDLIPAVASQQKNFQSLDGTSSVSWIAPLLLIIGIIVILFAGAMIVRNIRGGNGRRERIAAAAVVPIVGVLVVGVVLAISLIPRVSNGQKLLNGLAPAFTQQRVIGDRAGIKMVSAIVATEDPIMTAAGGAAAEVPKLISFVSAKTGLPPSKVVAALQTNFPHTTALLEAIPLSAVTAELPALVGFLTPGVVTQIPALLPTVLGAQAVTTGWDNVPGTAGTTRFGGGPIRTVPDVQAYFSSDVIPVLETQRSNYARLVGTSNIDFLGPLVLIVGIIVIIYGILIVLLAWRGYVKPKPAPAARTLEPVAAG